MLARMEAVRARAVLARTPALKLRRAHGAARRRRRASRSARSPPADARSAAAARGPRLSRPPRSTAPSRTICRWLDAERRAHPAVHRPGVSAAAARRSPGRPRRSTCSGRCRAAERSAARHGRLTQSHSRRPRHGARVRRMVCARRTHGHQRTGGGHRRRQPRRRARRRRHDRRGVRHRARPDLSRRAPPARRSASRRTARWCRSSRRARAPLRATLPAAQPHHQRAVARHAGGRGGTPQRLADHRAAGGRARPRGVCHPRLDPQPALARLPPTHQATAPSSSRRRRTSCRSCGFRCRKSHLHAASAAPQKPPALDKEYEMLLDALGFEPATIDILVARTAPARRISCLHAADTRARGAGGAHSRAAVMAEYPEDMTTGSVLDILIYVFDRYMLDEAPAVPEREHLARDLRARRLRGSERRAGARLAHRSRLRRTSVRSLRATRRRAADCACSPTASWRALSTECRGLLLTLERAQVLSAQQREIVIERLLALDDGRARHRAAQVGRAHGAFQPAGPGARGRASRRTGDGSAHQCAALSQTGSGCRLGPRLVRGFSF